MLLYLLSLAVVMYAAFLLRHLPRLYANVGRMHKLTAAMPGPMAYPLIGSLLEAMVPLHKLRSLGESLIDQHGTLFKFWFGPILYICVMEPEDVQVVLNSPHTDSKPGFIYNLFEPFLGKGLVCLNGPAHRRHRKAVTASMHLEILQDFMPTFNKNARKLVDQLDALAESGQVFDAAAPIGYCASVNVCETILSSEAPELEAQRLAFVRIVHHLPDMGMKVVLRPWYRLQTLMKWLDPVLFKEYNDSLLAVSLYAGNVLSSKKSKLADRDLPDPKNRRQTFLDRFLLSEDADELNQSELLEELKTLLLGASASSMDFLSTLLLCMALEPDVQRKVQQELDEVFVGAAAAREIQSSDFRHLPYLDSVLKETMRIFAPVPMIGRQVSEDVDLPGGQVIPKGSTVVVPIVLAHRNPRHFPDPLRFDPERFSPARTGVRHNYAFIPFSAGSRNCIGQRYSIMFAKTVAATVLRRFEVLPDPAGPQRLPDVEVKVGLTLTVLGGARVIVRRREAS